MSAIGPHAKSGDVRLRAAVGVQADIDRANRFDEGQRPLIVLLIVGLTVTIATVPFDWAEPSLHWNAAASKVARCRRAVGGRWSAGGGGANLRAQRRDDCGVHERCDAALTGIRHGASVLWCVGDFTSTREE